MSGPLRPFTGGCLCGQVRYRVDAPIADIAHCHCTMCRRTSGAVAVTWFTIRPDTFTLIAGELRHWCSSTQATRGFCPGCGCQITFQTHTAPDQMDVTLATLDDAHQHAAVRHIWTESRLVWLTLDPDLPASSQE